MRNASMAFYAVGLAFAALTLSPSLDAAYASDRNTAVAVHVYDTPAPDPNNSIAVETDDGLVVVSTPRTFSHAALALARFERTGKPIAAIVIPVPHTDHFGGLRVLAEAYPDADIYASQASIEAMRDDTFGYIASRRAQIGDDFPDQTTVNAYLPTEILVDGMTLSIGGVDFEVFQTSRANSTSNTVLLIRDAKLMFGSEVVETGVTAFLRHADLDGWIDELNRLSAAIPDGTLLYAGHGQPGPADHAIAEQRAHLALYQEIVDEALADDGFMDASERALGIARIEAAYPDYLAVARVPRAKLVGLNLDWQAEIRSASQ